MADKRRYPIRFTPLLPELADPNTRDALALLGEHFTEEVREIKSELGGKLTWENWQVEIVNTTSPSTADTPFSITHNLNRTPTFWVANPETAAIFYATSADRAAWTLSEMTLRCNAASVPVRIIVM